MNGTVEILVKSCKRALHAILLNRHVDLDVLHTALVEVEGIINSRPITAASSDPLDLEALTPNHILIYRPNLNFPFDVVAEQEVRNLEKEDLVMIVEPNVSRGMWQIGRVIEVYPGKDGRVRSAQVKTKSGNYVRPVARLCLLEEDDVDRSGNSTTQ